MGDNSFVGAVVATSGNLCGLDCIPGTGSNTWIIDTGASDHMTYDTTFFYELSSNTRDPYITSANGLPSPITGEGTISLTPTLSLSRALLVPNIHCNLLSVGRLLDTLNASATSYPTHCSFQDLETCETIGHVSRKNNKFGYGIVAWDTRRSATLSFCFHPYSALVMSLVLSGHGVLAATYLINHTPSRVLDFKTPLDVLCPHTSPVSVSRLPPKVFGCDAYVHVYFHQRSKLDPCTLRCVFIGYSTTQKGYKCYQPPTQKGENESKLESIGLQDLELRDVGEDDTNDDLGEKSTGRLDEHDRYTLPGNDWLPRR
ncbi:hypothetical protein L3X38_041792 [Prunus dulcis]|uniref:Eukaryotic aspartyl protease family protein n=1 Tax=Prunus dulcis TaxID=3755 RepID=A0AAD4UV23_PRUDU|nr:hypothetical protein L3X38_041792 [Prunus dulcis]